LIQKVHRKGTLSEFNRQKGLARKGLDWVVLAAAIDSASLGEPLRKC